MDCKYCRIAANQYPAHILYEDENVVAFLVENPVSKGHSVVVPREHAERYTEIENISGFAVGLKNFLLLMEEYICPDLHLVVNPGRKGGQNNVHFQMHIIPQYEGEKIFEWTWHQLTEEEVNEITQKVKNKRQD
ncbi:MAG: HIT family protein [Theionarchaea archaeon]|nr:HIT family protein [Theionarchaea archaeon]MBU7039135.1 HIT family protein [Theionarchaea archaeon]